MTYLDHAASTPVDPAVAAGMAAVLADPALQANPSSTHAAGDAARACVEQARAQVAALIGARPAEVVWTSGATEANNLAVIGAARLRVARGRHIVTAASEHASVLAACRELENQGFVVTRLATDAGGIVAPQAVAAALRADTTLVSLMQVNNETGVVQDVAAVGALCRSRGVLFHVDASQAAGREPIDVRSQAVDLLSLSAHKMYGPKGVGALFISRETARRVEPMLFGGGQERGLRPGTLATHQVAGMGLAAGLAAAQRPATARGSPPCVTSCGRPSAHCRACTSMAIRSVAPATSSMSASRAWTGRACSSPCATWPSPAARPAPRTATSHPRCCASSGAPRTGAGCRALQPRQDDHRRRRGRRRAAVHRCRPTPAARGPGRLRIAVPPCAIRRWSRSISTTRAGSDHRRGLAPWRAAWPAPPPRGPAS
ncbi:MAG: cysteine desulfurase [Rhodocyclaceae bacterium]|nr:cysteine desulfurase [Rhodocyclaceae bacterium]